MAKYILLVTKKGTAIKMLADNFRPQIRGGRGVKAIMLEQGDEVISVIAVD